MTGKHVARAIIFILILISLTACANGAAGSQAAPTFEGAQPVDRQFSDLISRHGGAPLARPFHPNLNVSAPYASTP